MTTSPNTKLGQVENRHNVDDVITVKAAASLDIAAGSMVYQDGANGIKIVPTGGVSPATRIRFLAAPVTNATGSLGDKEGETYKKNAKVVAKAGGTIVVGAMVKFSTVTAGRVDSLATWTIDYLGYYQGHPSEGTQTGNDPTDAVAGDEVVIVMG